MRKYLLLAAAAAVVATPAAARDRSAYVGIEAGPMLVEDLGLDFEDNDDDIDDAFVLHHNYGIDVGLLAGYDWGAIRTEVELGYKRASLDEVEPESFLQGGQGLFFDADGNTRVLSAMVNGLLDFGDENAWSGFVGAGVGLAKIRNRAFVDQPITAGRGFGLRGEDRVFAWQLLAGVRRALTQNIDLGVKYRFFSTDRFRYEETDGGGVTNPPFNLNGQYRSHSLLASLIYNFYTPPPPPPPVYAPPPPPPPPATKTCPDGSVVLVTDPCPLPPPPPPPPPPLPERG